MADNLKNVVSFVITVDEDVDQDFISITFSASETGPDANVVQSSLAVKLKDALTIARPKEVAGKVEVRTGTFQINPSYDKDGAINGYQGQVFMMASGIDTITIVELTGLIKSMNVSSVQQSVSADRRKQVEQDLAIKAIQKWREKSKTYADAFGAASFRLINADISFNNRFPMFRGISASAMGSGEISEEPGKDTITATISGSIQLV